MPHPIDYAMHAILATKIERVRRTAIAAGGQVTWDFSQCRNPVRSLICGHGATSGGICEMVSAKWLEMHARGGHIASWIQRSDGSLDPNRIRQLMQWFGIGVTLHPDRMRGGSGGGNDWDQPVATQNWLELHGIKRKTKVVADFFQQAGGAGWQYSHGGGERRRGGSQRRVLAQQLGEEITRSFGTYKMVMFDGPKFAHTCAAWSERDVAFFDPNFGEFWFEDRRAFVRWFPTFWHTAGYGAPVIGLSEGYDVREYFMPLTRNAA